MLRLKRRNPLHIPFTESTEETGDTNSSRPAIHPNDCLLLEWVGDGICDDSANNQKCHYDKGDCCDKDTNFDFCNTCLCKNGTEGSLEPGNS